MTLGRLQGAALIGRSLDVTIPIRLDAGQTLDSACFEADVFQGDVRQDPSRVQVAVERTQTPQAAQLHVRSSNLVDEPIVTVYLRSTCADKLSRRYVLLADVASDPLAPEARPAPSLPVVQTPQGNAPGGGADGTAQAMAMPGASSGGASNAGAASVRATAPRSARSTQRRARRAQAAHTLRASGVPAVSRAAVAPARAASVESARTTAPASQARLRLDPAELLSAPASATAPATVASAPDRVDERNALEAQRLTSLESSVQELLASAARNEATLQDLRAQLRETQRSRNLLVYALIALVLLCVLAIILLLARRGSQRPMPASAWWGGQAAPDAGATMASQETRPASATPRPSVFPVTSAPMPLVQSQPEPMVRQPQQTARAHSAAGGTMPAPQVDVSLVEMSESSFDRLMQSDASHSAVRKPASEAPGSAQLPPRRSINSDELFDVRQQAEFYVSLGQTDQAVRILEKRIGESGESSPTAYLDLLRIFYSLGLKADFRQVRDDFNVLFNARVPEFSDFGNEGRDLEHYPELLARIVAAWGTPAIFSEIEMWVFCEPRTNTHEFLDLAAFRDLLLLHAVAQNVAAGPDSVFGAPVALSDRERAGSGGAVRSAAGNRGTGSDGRQVESPLPTTEITSDIDIDLTDPPVVPPPLGISDPATERAPEAGEDNLIDFDLSGLPPAQGPRRPS